MNSDFDYRLQLPHGREVIFRFRPCETPEGLVFGASFQSLCVDVTPDFKFDALQRFYDEQTEKLGYIFQWNTDFQHCFPDLDDDDCLVVPAVLPLMIPYLYPEIAYNWNELEWTETFHAACLERFKDRLNEPVFHRMRTELTSAKITLTLSHQESQRIRMENEKCKTMLQNNHRMKQRCQEELQELLMELTSKRQSRLERAASSSSSQ